jgi:23S rRNA maturation mini-RNase III
MPIMSRESFTTKLLTLKQAYLLQENFDKLREEEKDLIVKGAENGMLNKFVSLGNLIKESDIYTVEKLKEAVNIADDLLKYSVIYESYIRSEFVPKKSNSVGLHNAAVKVGNYLIDKLI